MSETYKIKPLVWESLGYGYVARTIVGSFYASPLITDPGDWSISIKLHDGGTMEDIPTYGPQHSKELLEAYYCERLMQALEKV